MNGAVSLRLFGKDRRIAGGPFHMWSGEGIGLCLDAGNPNRSRATMVLDLEDFTAPSQAALHDTVSDLLVRMRQAPDAAVYIGCRAGIGRTGTLIAALAVVAGHPEAVAWTRRHYLAGAVETEAQAAAVAALDPGAVWSAYRARTGTTPGAVALYYYPDNASTFPHMLLRELGIPFELRLVDRKQNAQNSADYLRLNPQGLIPVLIDGGLTLSETAAIALHLVDRHPECGLAPAVGTADRALFYKWMIHLTNTLQPEILVRAYPERHVADPVAVADVKATAYRRIGTILDRIEAALGQGPYLLGARFSAADLFLAMLVRWTRRDPTPSTSRPNLAAHLARVSARPAVDAALRFEQSDAGKT